MALKDTMNGNRGLIKFGGQPVGIIQDITCADNSNQQSVDGMGSLETLEWVPGLQAYQISGSRYFGSAQDLQKLGLVPNSNEVLTAPEFEVEVIDRISGATLELYTGCKFNTHERRYSKHVIASESFSIVSRHKEI